MPITLFPNKIRERPRNVTLTRDVNRKLDAELINPDTGRVVSVSDKVELALRRLYGLPAPRFRWWTK